MKLASKLKKKSLKASDTNKNASTPTSGLAMWEAKLAEQHSSTTAAAKEDAAAASSPAGSPAGSPARTTSMRGVSAHGRRVTLTRSDSNDTSESSKKSSKKDKKESSSSKKKLMSPKLGGEKDKKFSTSSPSFFANGAETAGVVDDDDEVVVPVPGPVDINSNHSSDSNSEDGGTAAGQLSPRRGGGRQPSTPTKMGSGGLLSRFGKGKGGGGDDAAKKTAAAEEDTRRKAQMAALELFKEKGTCSYTVPAAYSGESGEVPAVEELEGLRQKEQERQTGRGKRSNDVLIEIVEGRPQLRAGTFEEIVKWIIFNNVNEHVSSFLITFRAYGTPADLWAALMRVFHIIEEKDKMPLIMKVDLRKKTLDLLVEWIRRFSYKDFTENGDKTLFKKLTKFIKSLPAEEANQFKLLFMRKRDDTSAAAAAVKAKEAEGSDSSRSDSVSSMGSGRFDKDFSSVEVPIHAPPASGLSLSSSEIIPISPPSMLTGSLHVHSPRVIAQQMSFLDAACFAEIQPEEMLLSNWTKPNKEEVAPTLTSLARQFNMWSGMVATDIILANSLMDQVMMVKQYIRVLHYLYRMNNFQSLMAVMSGLNCSSVSRLKRVWSRIPVKYTELFASMEQVMTPLGNFKYYRQILAENKDKQPIIPYLVVFLRDLTFINDGNCETLMSEPMAPTDVPRELPNFEKMVLLGQQILELEAYRKVPYDIEVNPTVTGLLKNVRYMDEDSLHRRSLEQEPIHSLNDSVDDENKPAEVVVKNPLVALKAISKDFKAVSASEETDLSGDLTLSESDDALSATF